MLTMVDFECKNLEQLYDEEYFWHCNRYGQDFNSILKFCKDCPIYERIFEKFKNLAIGIEIIIEDCEDYDDCEED